MIHDSENMSALGVWRWWPLRFLVFFVVLAVAYAGGQVGIFFLLKHPHGLPVNIIVPAAGILGALVLFAVYRLLVRWMEKRKASELLIARAPGGFVGGTVLGAGLFCAVYAVLFALGIAGYKGSGSTDGLALAFALSLLAGFGEEMVFRGVVFRLFEEGFGTTVAVLISGALFGAIHAGNPGATLASSAAIAIEAGILLAAAYALTRSLWLPIGLHFAWNFTEGGIFGAAVSGHESKSLLSVLLHGPDYLTGGVFGPEASVVAVGVCLTAAIVMLVLAAQRGEWRPLRFRFRTAGETPDRLAGI
jgi:membrane protease YdiL (CAAX protease family)